MDQTLYVVLFDGEIEKFTSTATVVNEGWLICSNAFGGVVREYPPEQVLMSAGIPDCKTSPRP